MSEENKNELEFKNLILRMREAARMVQSLPALGKNAEDSLTRLRCINEVRHVLFSPENILRLCSAAEDKTFVIKLPEPLHFELLTDGIYPAKVVLDAITFAGGMVTR